MTAVIAIDYLYGFIVLADTRVSFDTDSYDPEHGVQKIYPISDGHTLGVIGFSGSVDTAKNVFNLILRASSKIMESASL